MRPSGSNSVVPSTFWIFLPTLYPRLVPLVAGLLPASAAATLFIRDSSNRKGFSRAPAGWSPAGAAVLVVCQCFERLFNGAGEACAALTRQGRTGGRTG